MRLLKRNFLKSSEIDFGTAVFNIKTQRLHDHSGQEIVLRFRSREVLAVLMQHQGEVVSRSTLANAAWDVKTVSDDNIAQCIGDIRRALSDRDKCIIETVPRQGYRLVAPPGSSSARARSSDTAGAQGQGPARFARAPTIEVIPFENMGIFGATPPGLRDVIAEATVTGLARYPEMTVLYRTADPKTSAARKVSWVHRRSRADYLVTGAILSDGKRGRLGIRLVETEDMSCIWVEEFDFDLGELLALSRTIGRQVASAIGIKLIAIAEAHIDRGDVSAMLIENAARSRMIRDPSAAAFHRNIPEQDIALDRYPDSAWGHFGQALALQTGISNGWLTKDVAGASARAEALTARALALAPDNYLAHYALGKTLLGKGEIERALLALERATALNPSSTMVLVAQITPHLNSGNTVRALELITLAERISPNGSKHLSLQKAKTHWCMGATDAALRSLMASPGQTDDMTKLHAVVQLELGRIERARAAIGPWLASNPHWTLREEAIAQRAQGMPLSMLERWLSRLSEAGMPR